MPISIHWSWKSRRVQPSTHQASILLYIAQQRNEHHPYRFSSLLRNDSASQKHTFCLVATAAPEQLHRCIYCCHTILLLRTHATTNFESRILPPRDCLLCYLITNMLANYIQDGYHDSGFCKSPQPPFVATQTLTALNYRRGLDSLCTHCF